MREKRYIVDTTMRDGEQSAGIAMSKEQKILIAGLLDDAGVTQIEAGTPAVGSYEVDTLYEISGRRKNSKIAVWNRLNVNDIMRSFECTPDIIHISLPVSYAQIYSKLNKNKSWIVRNLTMCVSMAMEKGYEVTVGFEDASRADITFMISLSETLKGLGVSRVRFADTVGILTPGRTYQSVADLIRATGIEVEFHAHNDLGMAVANTLTASKAGASWLDTTILGIGERAGNCDFYSFIHSSEYLYDFGITKYQAMALQNRVSEILNITRN